VSPARVFLGLLLCAALATAGVEAPLGPYIRPGVPVVVRTSEPMLLDVDGWAYEIDGVGVIHPARVPCTVRDERGETVLRLEPVPEGARMVGAVSAAPGLFGPDARVVPIDLPEAWRTLDLFDVVVVSDPADWTPSLTTWVRGGGTVLLLSGRDPLDGDAGLGAVVRRAEDAAPRRVPRAATTRPEVYDLVDPPVAGSPALRSARWVVWGAGLAFAVQLTLAALGLLRRRLLLAGLGLVAVSGAVIGLVRPRADYTPVARGDLVVSWYRGGWERRQVYRVYTRVGPGARAPEAGPDTPILYGANTSSWWGDPGDGARLGEGIIRIYLREEVRPGAPELKAVDPPRSRALLAGLVGAGHPAWRVATTPGPAAPAADPGRIPVLGRVEVALQD
jgi:hypothetical protein